jgi:hypothetical protein
MNNDNLKNILSLKNILIFVFALANIALIIAGCLSQKGGLVFNPGLPLVVYGLLNVAFLIFYRKETARRIVSYAAIASSMLFLVITVSFLFAISGLDKSVLPFYNFQLIGPLLLIISLSSLAIYSRNDSDFLIILILVLYAFGGIVYLYVHLHPEATKVTTGQQIIVRPQASPKYCPNGYAMIEKGSSNEYFFDKSSSILKGSDYFCVMRYEAKCDMDGDNIGDYPNEKDLPRGQSYNWNDCSGKVTSSPDGAPIVNISQKSAVDVCAKLGKGYHLITNDEWMAIARDAENVQANWVDNTLPRGNSNNNYVVSGFDNDSNTVDSRYLYLSDGDVIWDLAGNVWEWINDTIKQGDQPPYTGWQEVNALSDYGTLHKDDVISGNAKLTSLNGIGKLFLNYSAGSSQDRAYLRGGSWGDGSRAGIYTLDFLNSPDDSHEYIGFRCAKTN